VFISDTTDGALASRTVSAAAFRALASEVQRRVIKLINTIDSGFELNSGGKIFWIRSTERQLVAGLTDGSDNLSPRLKVVSSDLLEVPLQNKIEERLHAWLNNYIRHRLMPLIKAKNKNLTGAARGLVFQLVENGGVLGKCQAISQLKAFGKADYRTLRHLGVKIGRHEIFFPKLLRPRSAGLSALLWAIKNKINPIPELPPSGRVSIIYDGSVPLDFMLVGGFKRAGELLVRVDILERLAGRLKQLDISRSFEIEPQILNLLGCSAKQAISVVCSLGYIQKKFETASQETIVPSFISVKDNHRNIQKKQKSKVSRSKNRNRLYADLPIEDSPFAKLKELSI
jgi:ATP-dependent RNA helicase SUPV3L1/SUV3